MSTTCQRTLSVTLGILEHIGCVGRGYTYVAKKPEKHRPSWVLHVSRLSEVVTLAEAIGSLSVTKRQQWEILLAFARSRLVGVTLDAGKVARGGRARPYGPEHAAWYEELRALNAHGPGVTCH